MRCGGRYLICKAVDRFRRRSRNTIRGKRHDFSGPGFAVGIGSEGREHNTTGVQVE